MSFGVALGNHNITYPGQRFQPLLTSSSGSGVDDIISKLSDSSSDAFGTFTKIGDGVSELLGQLVSGSQPKPWDLAKTIVPALLGLVDPFLGAAAGFIMSFLGSLFGGHSPSLWEQIEPKVEALVSEEILQQKVDSIRVEIEGLINSLTDNQAIAGDLPQQYAQALTDYDVWCEVNSQHAFDACYKSLNDDACKKWEQQGIIQYQIFFVNIHLHTKVALMSHAANNSNALETLSNQFWDHWHTYLGLLDHSFNTFKAYRLGEAIETGFTCYPGVTSGAIGEFGFCSVNSYRGDLLRTSKGAPKDFLAACGVTINQVYFPHNEPPRDGYVKMVGNAGCQSGVGQTPSCSVGRQCISNYKSSLEAELETVSAQIDSIKAMMGSMCKTKLHDMFELYLGRAEDPNGMQEKMSRCVTGQTTREQFIAEFTRSEEYCHSMLHGLYEQYLCRAEDPYGMQEKMSRCVAGTATRDEFIAELVKSEEYKRVQHPCPKNAAGFVV
jgi:hypothetical protein